MTDHPRGSTRPPPASRDESAARSPRVLAVLGGSLAVILLGLLIVELVAQDGVFTYAIDDAAIHLSITQQLAHHGTFGLDPGVYESASSAPLWDLVMAPVLRVAPGAWWLPLVLNVACAGWIVVVLSRIEILRRLVADRLGLAAVASVPIGIGLASLVLTGMEHTLHAAITVQVLALFYDRYRTTPSGAARAVFYGLLALGVLIRFEMGFLAGGLALALLLAPPGGDRRPGARTAGGVLLSVAVPFVAFALINLSFGQYALPNSVVAKTSLGDGLPIPTLGDTWDRLTTDLVLVVLFAVAAFALVHVWVRRGAGSSGAGALATLLTMVVATVLHVMFADVGWFHRYQAYLVIGLVYVVLLSVPFLDLRRPERTVTIGLLLLAVLRLPLLLNTPVATFDVYENQYQVARFLDSEYGGEPVAVNDIGYVSWMHDGALLDLYGLASHELLVARKDDVYTPELLADLLDEQGIEVMVAYESIFGGVVPDDWEAAGRWCFTTRHIVLSADCITFYAPSGPPAEVLQARLAHYEPRLPSSVDTARP